MVAPAVGESDHRALMIGMQEAGARAVERAARVRQDRLVDPGAEEVAPGDRAVGVIFKRQLVPIVKEAGVGGRPGHLEQPAHRVVDQVGRLHARSADQPVLDVVKEAGRPVRGQVAIGVVSETGGS